jgi:hypothetical protein
MHGIRGATLTVRFLCELGMLAAFAYWGSQVGDGAMGLVLGIAAPLLTVAIWWMFVAPKAKHPVALATRQVIEVLLFGLAAAALIAVGLRTTGVLLGVLGLGSSFLNAAQERGTRIAD